MDILILLAGNALLDEAFHVLLQTLLEEARFESVYGFHNAQIATKWSRMVFE